MNCKYCDHELPVGTHGRREYCNDAHKQAYYRQQHQQDQNVALLSELENLRAKVTDQAQTIEAHNRRIAELTQRLSDNANTIDDQAQEITRLRHKLDVDRRYLEDTTPRTFKSWMKKQPSSPWRDRFLSDQLVPARGSRSLYEAYARRQHCTNDEMEDFTRLWKLMLLSQP